ncbi:asparaginase [Uliginosibacterium sp. H1]|uniref:asparaginase n=1 Tax=Uliginosibacterium sp. H1 TaxID=3114757 RepID=UPI002E1832A7|nr:asparaginase [Uliginosibacterium sp. H1]
MKLALLATGGTIAGVGTAARYTAARLGVESLLEAVPQLTGLCAWQAEQVFALDSRDMTPAHWVRLARRCQALLDDTGIDGIVITHGTDTLEETAYALSLLLATDKPVVLTAAMRPATDPQADGPANLLQAAHEALTGLPGVRVAVHGSVIPGARLTKLHTQAPGAFAEDETPLPAIRIPLPSGEALPRVDLIHVFSGMERGVVDHAIAAGARGLVIAAAGDGSLPAALLPALRSARDAGITVVRGSRVPHDGVRRDRNADDTAEGWIPAGTLAPLKARAALLLSLAAGLGPFETFAALTGDTL